MRKDSTLGTLFVATVLCIVCSVLVSTAAVVLRPAQVANQLLDRKKNILMAAGLCDADARAEEILSTFKRVEARVVDFETGQFVPDIDAYTYDQRLAARDPKASIPIPSKEDFGAIKRRARRGVIYLIRDQGKLEQVVLPVHGKGLWGSMYAFLALGSDINTVHGLTFYEHIETPGLGGEVENPRWKASWVGKKVFGPEGKVLAEVIKGTVNSSSPKAEYQVDGLAGATITSRGVTNLLRYWLGEHGFGNVVSCLKTAEATDGKS